MTQPDLVDFMLSYRKPRGGGPAIPMPRGPGEKVVDGDPVQIADPVAYVASALRNVADELAETGEGGRNHALNAAAFRLGGIIGAGLPLNPDDAMTELLHACDLNGYNGEHSDAEKTIERGLSDGANKAAFAWEKVDAPKATQFVPLQGPAASTQPTQAGASSDVEDTGEHSSWWPRVLDAVLAGDEEEEPPSILARADGPALFYAGKVNALIGESESGKTWVALVAVADQLGRGERVVMLDFEDTASGVVTRLRALGVADHALRRLVYISPDETLHARAAAELDEVMHLARPSLVVVDGVNAAMTLLGLDLNSNTDTTRFSLSVLRPLKRSGAAVVTIDHVTKSKDGRGNYAIGAQAKRADIDGCALMVEVEQPFGRGQTGRLKLVVSKDRPGHVRGISRAGKHAATVVLDSRDDGTVRPRVEAPAPKVDEDDWRPTLLMGRVAQRLTDSPGLTRNQIKTTTTGKDGALLQALDFLIVDGFVECVRGAHRLVKPYGEGGKAPQMPTA